jgi:GT2 family glycosyltransferase
VNGDVAADGGGLAARRPAEVSVVVCAYTERRWDDLVAAVRSALAQTRRPIEVVVVVDHNPRLLARVRTELPAAVARESDGPQGLSAARNAGVRVARGDVIAFLDDDAVAAPDWLERLLDEYRHEHVVGVGGLVEPLWPGARPAFLPAEFDWVVGCSYVGLPTRTAPVRNPIGANMSLRRDALEAAGAFRTDVGRIGTRPLGCEETELCIRIRRRMPGSQIVYAPLARVQHRVGPERISWRYFAARCFSEGLSKAVVARYTGQRDGLASERSYATRVLPRGVVRGVADAILRGDATGWGRALAIVGGLASTAAGFVAGVGRLKAHDLGVKVRPPDP